MEAIFLYCAIYLGETGNFYYIIPNKDTILYATSGGMLCALGFSFIVLLNKTDRVPVNLSPIFICLFTFCFAVTHQDPCQKTVPPPGMGFLQYLSVLQ